MELKTRAISQRKVYLSALLLFFIIYLVFIMPKVKMFFYPLYREIKKESIKEENSRFNIIETNNFYLYYRDDSKENVHIILNNAEDALLRLKKEFNFENNEKITIIIYPEYEEMANKIGLGNGTIAMGVYFGGVISILDPTKWINTESEDGEDIDLEEVYNRDGPMVHELTHYMVDHLTAGNVPIWFTEGLALYEEYIINNTEWASSKVYPEYYTIEEMKKSFNSLDEVKAYRQSFLIVKYIGENYKKEALLNILKELRKGNTISYAIKKTTRIKIEDVYKYSLN
jgi:hypothetical protein